MIKIKCRFVSANRFYFEPISDFMTTVPKVNFQVTSIFGNLKNAVQVTIEFDDNGTIFSNGVKFVCIVKVCVYLEI
jgi:hypothetical protein